MTLSDSFATLRPSIDEATATSLVHLLARAGTSSQTMSMPEVPSGVQRQIRAAPIQPPRQSP